MFYRDKLAEKRKLLFESNNYAITFKLIIHLASNNYSIQGYI